MEFGVHLPLISFAGEQRSLDELLAFTETARDLGYTHLCANDHLVFSRAWLDGPTALAAVLAHSGQMTLATTVAVPVLRGPAATAKILAAIDLLSGGRLVVGLGPGSSARDYELVGVAFEERWKRLDEAVQALRAYWRADDVAFEGAFYSTAGFTLAPTPAQRPGPPIWIGSWGSPAGLRRVARLADGWLASGYNTTPELFAQAWLDVQAEVAARGRDVSRFPNGIATMWCYVTEDRARADAVLTDVLAPMLNRPPEQLRAILPIGSAEECAEKLLPYVRAGAQRVFLWPLADGCAQLEVFRERVVPLLENLAADQFLERGLVADRIEVRIVLCVRARRLGHVDRASEVLDRVGRPAGEALAAGEVVEQRGVLRMSLDQDASAGRRPRRTRLPRTEGGAVPRAPSRWARTPFPGCRPAR